MYEWLFFCCKPRTKKEPFRAAEFGIINRHAIIEERTIRILSYVPRVKKIKNGVEEGPNFIYGEHLMTYNHPTFVRGLTNK